MNVDSASHEVGTPLLGVTVLLVEDSEDVRIALRLFLQLGGATVLAAENVHDALELAASYVPHVVLLDMHLPDGSGMEVARGLRSKGWSGPIVAMSGGRSRSDEALYRISGCTMVMPKPIDGFELISKISQELHQP